MSGVGLEAVHGNVVSRTTTQLTVKGAFAVRHDHDAGLLRTVQIDVGPDTKVLKTGDPSQVLTSDAISVGQSIVAFGTFADASTTTPATLDATAGRVRLLPTHLLGNVNAIVPGQLNLKLRAIDRLGIDMFDFTGTGTSAAVDADPADYEVTTGTLSLASLATGETAKVLGFVTPFGAAPPDFDGRTVIDPADLPDVLSIGWGFSGTTTPFLSLADTGIAVDLTNASIGERHFLFSDWQRFDLLTPPASLTIVPAADPVVFGIAKRGSIELFTSFGDLVAAITAHLNAGDAAVSLTASGSYDSSTGTLTANRISVFFTSPN